jgi:hypothetical protein
MLSPPRHHGRSESAKPDFVNGLLSVLTRLRKPASRELDGASEMMPAEVTEAVFTIVAGACGNGAGQGV